MRAFLILTAALSATACLPMPPDRPHVTRRSATAEIAPDDRPAAFGRALQAMQRHGWLIAVSDRAAGLLASQSMNTGPKPCGSIACESRSTLQVTISDPGIVTVNLHREFWLATGYVGTSKWFVPTYEPDVLDIEKEQAALLAEIVPGALPRGP